MFYYETSVVVKFFFSTHFRRIYTLTMSSSMNKILVAPLDWGLGHATRCIPVIKALQKKGCEVILAGQGTVETVLKREIDNLTFVHLPDYNISYASNPFLTQLKFPLMVSKVLRTAAEEMRRLDVLITEHNIDGVVSDQRFGCHSLRVPCAYITHQLTVKMPRGFSFFEWLISRGTYFAARKFNSLWIPDFPGENNLTGLLSRKYPLPDNHSFIGPLSRFSGIHTKKPEETTDLLIMLSGPEPQRSLFEKMVLEQLKFFEGNAVVLLGKPGSNILPKVPGRNVSIFAHLESNELLNLIVSAENIICRGGYTTIMELVSLGKNALLVPTPGQTEQEYLCRRLTDKRLFASLPQKNFSLKKALSLLDELYSLNTGTFVREETLLENAVDSFLSR